MSRQQPVVVRAAVAHWRAVATWPTQGYLRDRFAPGKRALLAEMPSPGKSVTLFTYKLQCKSAVQCNLLGNSGRVVTFLMNKFQYKI